MKSILAFGCLVATLPAHAQSIEVQAKLRVSIEGADFLASVDREVRNGREGAGRIRIACIRGCPSPQYFEETADDAVLGLFQPDDTTQLLMTTWVTGSAYAVKVYHLSNTGIQKLLDEHSLGPPGFDESDGLTISVTKKNRTRLHTQLFKWNGRSFTSTERVAP